MVIRCSRCASEVSNPQADIRNTILCQKCRALEHDIDDPEFIDVPIGVRYENSHEHVIVSVSVRSLMPLILIPFLCFFSYGWSTGLNRAATSIPFIWRLLLIIALTGVTLFLACHTLMVACGKIELRVRGNDGQIFTGVGTLGFTRHFRVSEMRSVREELLQGADSNDTFAIVLECDKRIQFGSLLNAKQRYFMLQALRKLIPKR